jgi:hypothetical protein
MNEKFPQKKKEKGKELENLHMLYRKISSVGVWADGKFSLSLQHLCS